MAHPQQNEYRQTLGIFATLAFTADATKLNEAFQQLEQQFGQYVSVIQPLLELEPKEVIKQLVAAYPDNATIFNSPLAPKVIGRIQEYLKKKGAQDGGQT